MTAAELAELKRTLLQLLPDEGIGAVITALKKALPENAPKYSAVFQLETRLNMANRDKIRGVLSAEQLELAYNRIAADLLDLVEGLEESDFSAAGATNKSGSILYKIPHTMQVEQEQRCVVRLAFEEEAVIRNIELTDAVLQAIRVSEVMEVALVDPNEQPAFAIRAVNSAEQFLEKGDFTEWIFYVKPLRIGEYPLALRVSVVEVVAGRDRKKEIVLEETIQVVAEPEDDGFEESTTFKNAGYTFSYSAEPEAPPAATEPSGEKTNGFRRVAAALLILFLIGGGAWALGLRQEVEWFFAQQQDTKLAYEKYLYRCPAGRHRGQATQRIDSLDWLAAAQTGTDSSYYHYLYQHPYGAFEPDARRKLDSLARLHPVLQDTVSINVGPDENVEPDTVPDDQLTHPTLPSAPPSKPKKDRAKPNKPHSDKNPVAPLPLTGPSTPTTSTTITPAHPTPPVDSVKPEQVNPVAKKRSGFEMVTVPGGDFTMGSANGDKDECPHSATVKTFKIGKYEVTQADWKEIMGSNPSFYTGCDECPVEQVSWNDIQVFLQKASAKRGAHYRLPTEAEWEFAARGGRQSRGYTYAGSNRAGPVAWDHGNTERTNRVGRKTPNELGIYDMSGNVWEWCADLYQPYPNCKGKNNDERVLRGGGWRNYDTFCRVSNRNSEKPGKRDYLNGFRLVQAE